MGNMLAGSGSSSFDLPEFSTDGGAERFVDLTQQQVALMVRSGLNLDMVLNPFQMRRLGTSSFPIGEEGEGDGDASGDEDGKVPVRFGVHWNVPAHVSAPSISIHSAPAETGDSLALDGHRFFLRFVYSAAVPCVATITPLALEAPHPVSGEPIYATVPPPAPARTPAPSSSASLPPRIAAARKQLDSDLASLARPLTLSLHPAVAAAAELPLPPLIVLALAAAAGVDVPAALARACCPAGAPEPSGSQLSSGGGALSPAVAALLSRAAPARGAGAGRAPLMPLVVSVSAAVSQPDARVDEVPAVCAGEGAVPPSGSSASDASRRGWAAVVTTTAAFTSAAASAQAQAQAGGRPQSQPQAQAQAQGQPDAAAVRSARAAAFQAQMARNNARLVGSINGQSPQGAGDQAQQGVASPGPGPVSAAEFAGLAAAQAQNEGEGVGEAVAKLAASMHTSTTRQIVIAETGVFELLDIFGLTPPPPTAPAVSLEPARQGQEVAQPVSAGAAAVAASAAAATDCVICMGGPAEAVLVPCRHFALCASCAVLLSKQNGGSGTNGAGVKCPMCRDRVSEIVVV